MLTAGQEKELDYIPFVPEKITWIERTDEPGKITIIRPSNFRPDMLLSKITGKVRLSEKKLDIHGSYIFPLIDGEKTVRELAMLMGERFGEEVEPLYERFLEYCGMLWRNELIEIKGVPRKKKKK